MESPEPFEDRIAEISLDLWTILKKTILKKTPFRDVNFPGKIIKFGRGVLENPIQFQDILDQNQTKTWRNFRYTIWRNSVCRDIQERYPLRKNQFDEIFHITLHLLIIINFWAIWGGAVADDPIWRDFKPPVSKSWLAKPPHRPIIVAAWISMSILWITKKSTNSQHVTWITLPVDHNGYFREFITDDQQASHMLSLIKTSRIQQQQHLP